MFGWAASLVIAPQDCVDVAFADSRTHAADGGRLAAMFEQAENSGDNVGTKVTVVFRYSDIGGKPILSSHLSFRLQPGGEMDQRSVGWVTRSRDPATRQLGMSPHLYSGYRENL